MLPAAMYADNFMNNFRNKVNNSNID
jgi:hypothetical protein